MEPQHWWFADVFPFPSRHFQVPFLFFLGRVNQPPKIGKSEVMILILKLEKEVR